MGDTARKAFVATVVALAVVVGAFALWQLKVLVALLLLAIVIASAMRPGVEWLHRKRIPRPAGVAIHYVGFLGVIALFLWLVVPRALDQISHALGGIPTSADDVAPAVKHSTGVTHPILLGLQHRLARLPHGAVFIRPAVPYGRTAVEIFVGIFFTFAV